jgi:hypothetical protein
MLSTTHPELARFSQIKLCFIVAQWGKAYAVVDRPSFREFGGNIIFLISDRIDTTGPIVS